MRKHFKVGKHRRADILLSLLAAVAAPAFSQTTSPQSQEGTERVLYSFNGGAWLGDGIHPRAGLARDSRGNLYGTTSSGGLSSGNLTESGFNEGCGIVFKLTPAGQETVLYQFGSSNWFDAEGCYPESALVLDSSGNLYGTTSQSALGFTVAQGSLFVIDPAGQETLLHVFVPGFGDGLVPDSTVIRDPSGNLFGTFLTQGDGSGNHMFGGIFKLDPQGNYSFPYQFNGGTDGANPSRSRLLQDISGNLYGLATAGGDLSCSAPSGCGVVFEVTPDGQEIVLHAFHGGGDGIYPLGDLVRDAAGNLYGVTQAGGAYGNGVVFRVSAAGKETVLYAFRSDLDGEPMAGVILDAAGNLYGTTTTGGRYHRGSVFKLDSAGMRTEVYSFTGGREGGRPFGTLILDTAGHLYGTTVDGGDNGQGAVFEITLP